MSPDVQTADTPLLQRQRRAFSDPLRVRIRTSLATAPKTAKELGEQLRVEPNRLYYHLRILEDAQLVGVVDTRAEGRMTERVFGIANPSFGSELPGDDPVEKAGFFASLFDSTREELQSVVFRQAAAASAATRPPLAFVLHSNFRADEQTAEAFSRDLQAFLDGWDGSRADSDEPDVADVGSQTHGYVLTLALYELDSADDPND